MTAARQARSSNGVVCAGSPHACEAGARVLRAGGNAADAAVATALALAVADPANNSLFGRCQVIVRTHDGACAAIDGASEAPAATPLRTGAADTREAYRAVPIPGLPSALEMLHHAHGRLPLAQLAAPAVEIADRGFAPGPHLAAVWASRADELRANAAARRAYLAQDADHAPGWFRHPRLAVLIGAFGARGAKALMQGAVARELAQGIASQGGYWVEGDLSQYTARNGEVVRGRFRDCEVITVGRQAWGHTVVEMLSILDALPRFGQRLTAAEAERLALTILCTFSDRPQALGSLQPKIFGLPYETLVDRAFTDQRAALVQSLTERARVPALPGLATTRGGPATNDQDTTHLSVIDADGASVAITCSIGPHFGARVADPVHGVLLAHSYRMASDPAPNARDETEMAPVIVTRGNRLLMSLGAAGSERIPGAIVQTIVNVVDRGLGLAEAVAFPRVNIKAGRMRVHEDVDPEVFDALVRRGYHAARSARGHAEHLGVVHACAAGDDGEWVGAADPAWDGSASVP